MSASSVPLEMTIPKRLSVWLLYRIAQEAMRNAGRHGNPSSEPGEDARAAWSTSSTRFGNHITVGCQLQIQPAGSKLVSDPTVAS